MIAITTGKIFADIDAIASSFALQEIVKALGKDSNIVLPHRFSASISESLLKWFDKGKIISIDEYQYPEDEIYILDISEQAFLSPHLDLNKVTLLYDHHFGFEHEWKKYNIKDLKIEKIGATATQVFELYTHNNVLDKLTTNIANLLYVTILTHTLNLNTGVTTDRDRKAIQILKNYITINESFIEQYYNEVEKDVLDNISTSVINDTKFATIQGKEVAFGQLELWNAKKIILEKSLNIVQSLLSTNREEYLFSSPSISEGKNYAFTNSVRIEELLINRLDFKRVDNLLISDKLLLRKEILKEIQ